MESMKPRQPSIVARALVGVGFALAGGLFAGYVYQKRDVFFEWDWANAHGKLEETVNPQLVAAARDFAESKHPGEACVARPLAKDEKFVYAAITCGSFQSEHSGEDLVPSRLRYKGESITSLEQPTIGSFENSLRRLVPKDAWEKMRYGFPKNEVLQAGLDRMKERGLDKGSVTN